jgi:WD40 repeat protein
MPIKNIKIFISSPGDVGQERLLTRRTIERLQGEFKAYVTLEPILWEHEPLRATEHFQEQILLPSTTDIVICILWARLGTRLPEKFKKPDGSSYSSGTEWEFEDAAQAYKQRKVPDLLVYRKMEDPPINMKDNTSLFTLEQKNALDVFLNKWFGNPQNGFEAAFHTFNDLNEFEDKLEIHLRKLILNRIPEHLAKEDVTLSWFSGSPYMGLEAFDIDHSAVFYGRTKDMGKIKEALSYQAAVGCAFLMVLGKSGCGKSSLIRAGIIPNITYPGVIEGIEYWRQAYFRPGGSRNNLLQSFTAALLQKEALDGSSSEKVIREMKKYIKEDKEAFVHWVKEKLLKLAKQEKESKKLLKAPETRFVIFIDQMEEIFTVEGITEQDRKEFISVLSMLARSGQVWVISTMRSDFYSRCTELPELIAMKEGRGHYDLMPPTAAEIGQMIRQPARASGIKFEKKAETGESLDEIILQTASSNTEILPLLEFTLDELYKKRKGNILTFEAYEKMGGLEGAIASKAEEVLEKLPQEIKNSLPLVFRQLITIQTKNENIITSRMVEINRENWGEKERQLIKDFVEARLLVADNMSDGKAIVTIAHEALIYNWPRLQKIINEDRDFLRIRARVMESEDRWEKEKKNSDFLLPEGKPLFEADYLLKNKINEIEVSLITYIKESIKKSRRKKRNRIIAITTAFSIIIYFAIFSFSQWQTANAQTKIANSEKARAETNAVEAQSQKQKAETNAADAQSQRQIAETNAKEALSQKQKAENNASEAQFQRQIAEINAKEALSQTQIAETQKMEAQHQQKIAEEQRDQVLKNQSLYLADQSKQQLQKGDRMMAMMLALEGLPKHINNPERPYSEECSGALTSAVRSMGNGIAILRHNDTVEYSCFSPDGKNIATLSSDGKARIWNAKNGAELLTIPGYAGRVNYIDFSPNGKFVVIAMEDGYTYIWDIEDGKELIKLLGHAPRFSPDGKRIVTVAEDQSVRIWNAENGNEIVKFETFTYLIHFVCFSTDGKRLYTLSWDGSGHGGDTIRAWDIESRKEVMNIEEDKVISSIRFSADGKRMGIILFNHTLRICDTKSGNELITLVGHSDEITSADFSPDGKRIVTASKDKTARIWDVENGKELVKFEGRLDGIDSVEFSPDGKRVVSALHDNTVCIWNAENGVDLLELTIHTSFVNSVRFSPDGKRVVTASSDKTACIWDVEISGNLKGHTDDVRFMQFSPDEKRLVTASADKTARIWDIESKKELVKLEGHTSSVNTAVFSPDSKRIVTTSFDSTARIWDAENGKELVEFKADPYPYFDMAKFSPNGTYVATIRSDTAQIWDSKSGKELMKFRAKQANSVKAEEIKSIEFSFDEKFVVMVSSDGTARILDVENGKELVKLKGYTGFLNKAEFSSDGKHIITDSTDGVRILDAASGKELRKLDGHFTAKFRPDEKNIVTVSNGNIIHVWDIENGKELKNIKIDMIDWSSLEFSMEGKYMILEEGSNLHICLTESGKEIITIRGLSPVFTSRPQLSPSGKYMAEIVNKNEISIFDMQIDLIRTEAINQLQGRELTTEERRAFFVWN